MPNCRVYTIRIGLRTLIGDLLPCYMTATVGGIMD
jgi:hypothetical protein